MRAYNIDYLALNRCLSKVKEDVSLEEFKSLFYHRLEFNGGRYTENQFDPFLEALHKKDAKEYHDCYSKMLRMHVKYAKEHIELLAALIDSNNIDLIQTAYDMYKRKLSIIRNLLPVKANKNTVKDADKKLLYELEKLLLTLESKPNDSIIIKAQSEFSKFYSEYSDNPYLGEYYNDLLNSIEAEVFDIVNEEISKVPAIKTSLKQREITDASFENKELFEKNKRNKCVNLGIFSQTFR